MLFQSCDLPFGSGGDIAGRIGPLSKFFVKRPGAIDFQLAVVGQADRSVPTAAAPGPRIDPIGLEAAAVTGALELPLARRPTK